MANSKYTKDGVTFVRSGARVNDNGKDYYCVSESWLKAHGWLLYTELQEDGTDGEVNGNWVHYLGSPYVAPEPEPAPEPTEEELAIKAEQNRVSGLNAQINYLEAQLSAEDYKIIKCSEASILGEELPYDLVSLHTEREELRWNINQYQEMIADSTHVFVPYNSTDDAATTTDTDDASA